MTTLFESVTEETKPSRGRAFASNGSKVRHGADFYRTPDAGILALLERESFLGSVLEPCCGDGAISRVLEERFANVISRDLFDRGFGDTPYNFLCCNETFDNVITNPPFKLGLRFIEKSLQVTTRKTAMLLPLTFMETIQRAEFLRDSPLKTVYVFANRLKFDFETPGKGGAMCFAWFVWDKAHSGKPELDWII